MRRIILAGNWKMNQTPKQAKALLEELKSSLPATRHTVAVFPPYLALTQAVAAGEPFLVGAQNCHFEDKGILNRIFPSRSGEKTVCIFRIHDEEVPRARKLVSSILGESRKKRKENYR